MAKKILVVVDAQNDFITGALGNKECDVATNVIAEEIRSGKYDDVIFTRDTHLSLIHISEPTRPY